LGIGFIDKGTKGKLVREKTLTLDKAIDIAYSNELTSKQLELIMMKSDTTSLLKEDANLVEKRRHSTIPDDCLLGRNRLSYSLNRLRSKSVFLKKEAIPRLELMAALTLANLIRTVSEALIFTIKIDAVFNWISSQIVLCWIQGVSRCFKPFEQNLVQKIRSLWVKELCRYFPTDLNPSDIAS